MIKTDADANITYGGANCVIKHADRQCWLAEINSLQRLTAYCRFKSSLIHEKYLDLKSDKRFKIALCKFEYLRIIWVLKEEDTKKSLAKIGNAHFVR